MGAPWVLEVSRLSERQAMAHHRQNWEEVKSLRNVAADEKRNLTAKERRLFEALLACMDARTAYWREEGPRAERAAKISALAKRALKAEALIK